MSSTAQTAIEAARGIVAALTVNVTNVGSIDGNEIVQVYVTDPTPSQVVRYYKRLAGFAKVSIARGETAQVDIDLLAEDLAYHGRDMTFAVAPGTYTITVGSSSDQDNASVFVTI